MKLIKEIKVWFLNLFSVSLSLTNIEWTLKILALVLTIGYTIQRIYMNYKKIKDA